MPTNHSISSAMLSPSSRITLLRAAATSVNSCTGARGATSHGTSVGADLPGCRSAPGAQNTGIRGRLPAGQPGPAGLQCRPANNRCKGYRDSNSWYLAQGAALSELIWRLRPRGLPALPVRQPTRRRSVLPVSKCRGGKSNEDLCSFVHRRNRRFESLFLRLLPIRSSRSQFLSKQQCSQGDVITRNTEAHWNCSSCSRGVKVN